VLEGELSVRTGSHPEGAARGGETVDGVGTRVSSRSALRGGVERYGFWSEILFSTGVRKPPIGILAGFVGLLLLKGTARVLVREPLRGL